MGLQITDGAADSSETVGESVRNHVAIVLAQAAVDLQNSDGTVIATLAQHAIEKFQPSSSDNRREPSSDEANDTAPKKKLKKHLTLNDNNHPDVQAMRRKLKSHPELETDVYHFLTLVNDPLAKEFREAFSEHRSFEFMDEAKETVLSAYEDNANDGEFMTKDQMAAALGNVHSEENLKTAQLRIDYCKTKIGLCDKEEGTDIERWLFVRKKRKHGHRKDQRSIAKSYNTNNKFAIAAQKIQARAAYSDALKVPIKEVTDDMVDTLGIEHWLKTSETQKAVKQAQEVAKALGSETATPKAKTKGQARPQIIQVSPTDELFKSVPKVISEYKDVNSDIKKYNKIFAGSDCSYISTSITNLKNLNQKKKINEEYYETVVQGVPKKLRLIC